MTTKIQPKKPILDLSYGTAKELDKLVDTAKKANIDPKVPIYMGSYGISAETSAKVHELPNGKYAPIVSLVRHNEPFWNGRQVKGAGNPSYTGPIPKDLSSLTPGQRYGWGVELGRRIRDDIRSAQKSGTRVDSWQLDEIWPSACEGTPAAARERDYLRGVMAGLDEGRPELGDKPMKGLVYIAHANDLANQPLTPELQKFWQTLDQSTTRVIGETYPNFAGDPTKMADQWLSGQQKLASEGGVYASIASKYVIGATPGYRTGVLGGVIKGQTRAQANQWRDAFLQEARKSGVAGFGEYNWLPGNDTQQVANDVMKEMGKLVGTVKPVKPPAPVDKTRIPGNVIFDGPGMFVDNPDAFSPQAWIPKLQKAGVKWIALQTYNAGDRPDRIATMNSDWAQQFRKAGIKVGIWGVGYENAAKDGAGLANSARESHADFVIADCEGAYQDDPSRNKTFTDAFNGTGPLNGPDGKAMPRALSSMGRVAMDFEPWINNGWDAMPQTYLNSYTVYNPVANVQYWETDKSGTGQYTWPKDRIHPTIATYPASADHGDQTQTIQIKDYVPLLKQAGTTGFSYYLPESYLDDNEYQQLLDGMANGMNGPTPPAGE